MLSLFPQILFLAPFSALMLRVSVACVFLYIVLRMVESRDKMVGQVFPIVGQLPMWAIWAGSIMNTTVAVMLLLGILTQFAAIVGMIIALKLFIYAPRLQNILPLPRSMYVLLFVICLSILLTGAGAFAFDLPL